MKTQRLKCWRQIEKADQGNNIMKSLDIVNNTNSCKSFENANT